MTGRSPWEVALGPSADRLHPRLRAYTAAVPPGSLGRGSGTFEFAGAPNPVLRRLLAPLSPVGILHPAWERDVPFEIVNRPGPGPSVSAERTLRFSTGAWTMRDRVTIDDRGLADHLGAGGILRVGLRATVRDGALHLSSTTLAVRLARWWVRVPRPLAPSLRLEERYDDREGRQRVHLRLTAPLLGVLYEYRGGFTYAIEGALPA
ncbi:MAG: hypothetical protein QOE37_2125 [Microbacteriaceae bacterium]|nr:hypothetical protein [Microbacteriaceae bacterium]